MNAEKITFQFVGKWALYVLFIWVTHELSHFLTSHFLGIRATLSLNSVTFEPNQLIAPREHLYIDASGPLATLTIAFLAFLLLKKRWSAWHFALVFIAFYMRSLAGVMNFVNLNDEGRISHHLGLGTYTVPILVSALLFWMVYRISKKYRLSKNFLIIITLLTMVVSSAIILLDQTLLNR